MTDVASGVPAQPDASAAPEAAPVAEQSTTDQYKEKAAEVAAEVKERAGEALESAGEAISEATDKVVAATKEAASNAVSRLRNNASLPVRARQDHHRERGRREDRRHRRSRGPRRLRPGWRRGPAVHLGTAERLHLGDESAAQGVS